MANNNLTPEQDLTTRAYLRMVLDNPPYLATNPAQRRSVISACLSALNYTMVDSNTFIDKETTFAIPYGRTIADLDLEDEWEADEQRAREQLDNKGKRSSSTSKQTKSS